MIWLAFVCFYISGIFTGMAMYDDKPRQFDILYTIAFAVIWPMVGVYLIFRNIFRVFRRVFLG